MRGRDDAPAEMTPHEIDDAAAERLLRGAAASDQEPLTALLAQMRSMSAQVPEPSPALAALLHDGFTPGASSATAPAAPVQGSRWGRRLATAAGLSLGMKVLAGTGVALAAVGTAAGAGVLPDPVSDRVGSIVRTLTPFGGEQDREPATTVPARPAPVSPTATTPTLPSPAPMEQPARGTAPQVPPTLPPSAGSRPTPAPQPGASRPQERPTPPAPSEQRAPQSSARPESAPAQSRGGRSSTAPTSGETPRAGSAPVPVTPRG